MDLMHPSELSRLESQVYHDRMKAGEAPRPGSAEEQAALDRIDELREEDQAGVMRRHPDMLTVGGARRFYRRGAPANALRARRVEATKYWRRRAAG